VFAAGTFWHRTLDCIATACEWCAKIPDTRPSTAPIPATIGANGPDTAAAVKIPAVIPAPEAAIFVTFEAVADGALVQFAHFVEGGGQSNKRLATEDWKSACTSLVSVPNPHGLFAMPPGHNCAITAAVGSAGGVADICIGA
jgi:hypothetical protein